MALAQRDTDAHTYADYLAWPDEVRYELIDGVAWAMAPAPTLEHQDVAGEIYRQIANRRNPGRHPARRGHRLGRTQRASASGRSLMRSAAA